MIRSLLFFVLFLCSSDVDCAAAASGSQEYVRPSLEASRKFFIDAKNCLDFTCRNGDYQRRIEFYNEKFTPEMAEFHRNNIEYYQGLHAQRPQYAYPQPDQSAYAQLLKEAYDREVLARELAGIMPTSFPTSDFPMPVYTYDWQPPMPDSE